MEDPTGYRKEVLYMEYGLIGARLGHSYSKVIHEMLCGYKYDLCPLPTEEEVRGLSDPAAVPGHQCDHPLQGWWSWSTAPTSTPTPRPSGP